MNQGRFGRVEGLDSIDGGTGRGRRCWHEGVEDLSLVRVHGLAPGRDEIEAEEIAQHPAIGAVRREGVDRFGHQDHDPIVVVDVGFRPEGRGVDRIVVGVERAPEILVVRVLQGVGGRGRGVVHVNRRFCSDIPGGGGHVVEQVACEVLTGLERPNVPHDRGDGRGTRRRDRPVRRVGCQRGLPLPQHHVKLIGHRRPGRRRLDGIDQGRSRRSHARRPRIARSDEVPTADPGSASIGGRRGNHHDVLGPHQAGLRDPDAAIGCGRVNHLVLPDRELEGRLGAALGYRRRGGRRWWGRWRCRLIPAACQNHPSQHPSDQWTRSLHCSPSENT